MARQERARIGLDVGGRFDTVSFVAQLGSHR